MSKTSNEDLPDDSVPTARPPLPMKIPRPNLNANGNLWDNGPTDLPDVYRPTFPLSKRKQMIEEAMKDILTALGIDFKNDPNTKDTPKRVAKMFVDEVFVGRFSKPPKVTSFPNTQYDQMIVVGPIPVKSYCSHHFVPIVGQCWIGILPDLVKGKLIGLSKYNRLTHWICRRPQIQEEMTNQIANKIEELTHAQGVAVYIEASHMCGTHRGTNDSETLMKTSDLRGHFREAVVKTEFLSIVNANR